jgi:hypothetical protein
MRSSYLVNGMFTEVRVLKTVECGFTQPTTAENWHVSIDSSGVHTVETAQFQHWYCFVKMGIEKLQSFYSLFLHIEFLHPTPESLIMI